MVLLERSPECRGVNRVLIDNESGMYTAARYLLDQGHKEIVYLNRDLDSDVEKDRLHGFLRAMQAAPGCKILGEQRQNLQPAHCLYGA